MNEQERIKGQIIGVDNQTNITNVKVLSGEVMLIQTVKEKIQQGQKFSVVDPDTAEVADVIVANDGTLKMKYADGKEKSLEKLPIFT